MLHEKNMFKNTDEYDMDGSTIRGAMQCMIFLTLISARNAVARPYAAHALCISARRTVPGTTMMVTLTVASSTMSRCSTHISRIL